MATKAEASLRAMEFEQVERNITAIERLAAAFERVAQAQEFAAGLAVKPFGYVPPVVDPSSKPVAAK